MPKKNQDTGSVAGISIVIILIIGILLLVSGSRHSSVQNQAGMTSSVSPVQLPPIQLIPIQVTTVNGLTTTIFSTSTLQKAAVTQVPVTVPPIPGFPVESILLGVAFGLVVSFLVRKRSHRNINHETRN